VRFRRADRAVPEDQAADRRSVNRRGNVYGKVSQGKTLPPAIFGIKNGSFAYGLPGGKVPTSFGSSVSKPNLKALFFIGQCSYASI
jgi:hypothetical protein